MHVTRLPEQKHSYTRQQCRSCHSYKYAQQLYHNTYVNRLGKGEPVGFTGITESSALQRLSNVMIADISPYLMASTMHWLAGSAAM